MTDLYDTMKERGRTLYERDRHRSLRDAEAVTGALYVVCVDHDDGTYIVEQLSDGMTRADVIDAAQVLWRGRFFYSRIIGEPCSSEVLTDVNPS